MNSCNGFLSLIKKYFRSPCIICNFITRKYIEIPKPEKDSNLTRFIISGFGYSLKNNQYKALTLVFNKAFERIIEVYTLGTVSWRRLSTASWAPVTGRFATYLNGVLHWPCDDFDLNGCDFIVGFDFEDERFCGVPGPLQFAEKPSGRKKFEYMTMGVLGGCLCVCDFTYPSHFEIWVMKDYGVQESWNRQFTIDN